MKVVKRYRVTAPKNIGKDKPMWLNAGTMTKFENGNMILELNHLPGIIYQLFEVEEKNKEEETPAEDTKPGESES